MAVNKALDEQISGLVASNQVALFMKGTRQTPQCGFSAQVVKILDELAPNYATIDVLSSPDIRDGIKEFSKWPTIPQLFVRGEFIGGCDIVRNMHASGELHRLLHVETSEPKMPTITISDEAGGTFNIDNPNQPAQVKQLSAPELKSRLDLGEVTLFDVRPEDERAIAKIAVARALDAAGQAELFGLDRNRPIVLHCHHGIRSQEAAQQLLREGFRRVYNLDGGIDAWSQTVDSSIPRY